MSATSACYDNTKVDLKGFFGHAGLTCGSGLAAIYRTSSGYLCNQSASIVLSLYPWDHCIGEFFSVNKDYTLYHTNIFGSDATL